MIHSIVKTCIIVFTCIFLASFSGVRAEKIKSTDRPTSNSVLKVIFETDMGNDVDDVIALDMLYKYMDAGKVKLLAVNSNKNSSFSYPFIQLLNNWYGYPSIPVGKVVNGANSEGDSHNYARTVCEYKTADGKKAFPSLDSTSKDFKDAVVLYRKILAKQPDHSVTIISVGFSTNLSRLLDTPPDQYSPLDGKALVAKKVKLLSVMAGNFTDASFREYNVVKDVPAARKVFAEWPGEIVVSPFEVGVAITYPASSILNDFSWTPLHPLVVAYESYLPMPYDRPTWDPTAVLYGVEGAGNYFDTSVAGTITVDSEGHTSFTKSDSGKHHYLTVNKQQIELIKNRLVSLVTTVPKHYKK